MDIGTLFSFSRPKEKVTKPLILNSNAFEIINFPGGHGVKCINGSSLLGATELLHDVQKDLFVCAEQCVVSICQIAPVLNNMLTVEILLRNATGVSQRVTILNSGEMNSINSVWGEVNLIPMATFIASAMTQSLRNYPSVGKPIETSNSNSSPGREQGRFQELGLTAEEFEETQKDKYLDAYRTMRGFIPLNISNTTLKAMQADGVPAEIAERIWSNKVLWLICMHPDDSPKIHIGDLRGRYHFHGLDLVEMRALWHCLPVWVGDNPKAEWKRDFKRKLDALLAADISGTIEDDQARHSAYEGYEGLAVYDADLPLVKQLTKSNISGENFTEESTVVPKLQSPWSVDLMDVDQKVEMRAGNMSSIDEALSGHDSGSDSDGNRFIKPGSGSFEFSDSPEKRVRRKRRSKKASGDRHLMKVSSRENRERMRSGDDASSEETSSAEESITNSRYDPYSEKKRMDDDHSPLPLIPRSQRKKPAKRLSFHATPKHSASRLSIDSDSGGLPLTSQSSGEYGVWHDFKTNDSFFTPTVSTNSGSGQHGEVTSAALRDEMMIRLQGDFDEETAVGRLSSDQDDTFPYEDDENQANDDEIIFDDDDRFVDSLELAESDSVGLLSSLHNSDRHHRKTRSHFMNSSFHFPKAVDVAESFASVMKVKETEAQSPDGGSRVGEEQSSFSSFRFLPTLEMPDALKVFTASTSNANYRQKHGFGKKKASPDGLSRFKFFKAKQSGATQDDSESETEESVGELDDFNDSGLVDLEDMEAEHGYIQEDFRDLDSLADSVGVSDEERDDGDDSDYHSQMSRSDSVSDVCSESTTDYLEPQNLSNIEGDQSEGGSLSWKSYWANFRSRKYNFLSLDEEEEDRQIENEIDNFIVPDELTVKFADGRSDGYLNLGSTPTEKYVPAAVVVGDVSPRKSFMLSRSMSDMDGVVESLNLEKQRSLDREKLDGHDSDVDSVVVSSQIHSLMDAPKDIISDLIQNYIPFHNFRPFVSSLGPSFAPGIRESNKGVVAFANRSSPVPSVATAAAIKLRSSRSNDEDNNDHISAMVQRLSSTSTPISTPLEALKPVSVQEVEEIMLYGDTSAARKMLEDGRVALSSRDATAILLRAVENIDDINEPLELLMLLIDFLGADPNVRDSIGNCPLHSLFSKPTLGRYLVSRGGEILAKDSSGDSVLQLCLEYGYDWIVPAIALTSAELDSPDNAREFCLTLLSLAGHGVKVKEFIDDKKVKISADEALDILDKWKGNYEGMKDPVETFELLESLILEE